MLARLLILGCACAAAVTAVASPGPEPRLQLADLRSFLHGEPPAPPKAPPPDQLAVVSTLAGATPDPQVEDFLHGLARAIKARDGTPMLSRLSDQYAIDDLPADREAATYFLQAVGAVPGPSAIVVKSVARRDGQRIATVEMHYADVVRQKTFRFDAAGRLVWSDWFVLQTKHAGG
jgi:hypothetical protein